MTQILYHSIIGLIRWGIYLIFIGEVGSCTVQMHSNAHKSVKTGLVSLKAINNRLHYGSSGKRKKPKFLKNSDIVIKK